MKKYNHFWILTTILLVSCQTPQKENYRWLKKSLDAASIQLKIAGEKLEGTGMFPRSIHQVCDTMFISRQLERDPSIFKDSIESESTPELAGQTLLCPASDWTSGFFPGELWYMYEYTQDDFWKKQAQAFTANIEDQKTNGGTHDMGFKMYCSFGNGYRLTNDANYKNILLESAATLITRYKPTIGCIRSWDHSRDKWQCPVIIDNMMNLELLYWAFKETGDSVYYNIANTHARTTMKNHFRDNYSSYHVIDYDTITGDVLHKHTHQGYNHESAWSRGQAWGLYGYTMCYRETKLPEFLSQAENIANYIFTNPTMP